MSNNYLVCSKRKIIVYIETENINFVKRNTYPSRTKRDTWRKALFEQLKL